MLFILKSVSGSKLALVLVSVVVILTVVDSQFIRVFYGTDFGTPGALHMLLFVSFVIIASIINIILLLFARANDVQARTSKSLLFRVAYTGTFRSSILYITHISYHDFTNA